MNLKRHLLPLLLGLSLSPAVQGAGVEIYPVPMYALLGQPLTPTALPALAGVGAEADLWQRLRDGMALDDLDSPLVAAQERSFGSRTAYMENAMRRARPYLYHIVEAVEARGLPAEIALLPLVESAYNPRAASPAKASGIWQFMPATGRIYGLKQNGWYDGRQDVVSATTAALDHLKKLHYLYGDWHLALAAYNCGDGCVNRAIARNVARGLPTDYLSLELPGETRNYVPRLLAVRNLVREPRRHGLALQPLANQPYFQEVRLPYPIEARTAARLAGIDLDELLALNPGFRRHVIHAESQDRLLLPIDRLDAFRSRLEAEESQRIRMRSYRASKGELLAEIAGRFDVTVQWLKDHNPLQVKQGKIAKTQTLLLPPARAAQAGSARTGKAARAPAAKTKQIARATVRTHTVRKGDTLSALAKRYKVTVADIREHNDRIGVLRPGAKIHIPLDS